MRGEHPELLHHTALDLGGGRGRNGRGDSLAPRPSLSLYHHYLLTPLGPEAGSHPPNPPAPSWGLLAQRRPLRQRQPLHLSRGSISLHYRTSVILAPQAQPWAGSSLPSQ